MLRSKQEHEFIKKQTNTGINLTDATGSQISDGLKWFHVPVTEGGSFYFDIKRLQNQLLALPVCITC